jgi:hypothetical protein
MFFFSTYKGPHCKVGHAWNALITHFHQLFLRNEIRFFSRICRVLSETLSQLLNHTMSSCQSLRLPTAIQHLFDKHRIVTVLLNQF